MTDNNENKDKNLEKKSKLTAPSGGSKLSLTSRPKEGMGSKLRVPKKPGKLSSVTVEVKKGLVSKQSFASSSQKQEEQDQDLDVNDRLNLLKRAAIGSKEREKEEEKLLKAKEERDKALKAAFLQETLNEEKEEGSKNYKDSSGESIKYDKKELIKSKTDTKTATPQEKPAPKKKGEHKKLQKNDILGMLGEDGESPGTKTRSLASIKRAREKERRKQQEEQGRQEKIYREVKIPDFISVSELASRMSERVADVIKELMKLGIIANANQEIDTDTAEIVVDAMGHTSKRVQESDVENILSQEPDEPKNLQPRAPVVTVMGHVDHGKTSLLDALKSTDTVESEAGGITQHIGAYRVNLPSGSSITFIDTPGHAAFTEMRNRGAKVTDIVVLVVAADDGIKAQTIEAINHAKAANVEIIVAINKIDKPEADVERVKNELLSHNLVPEDLGGNIMVVPVSAKNRQNLDKLEETILLVAEMGELKANPNAEASGAVIESRIDKGKGVLSTILVQRGTLNVGDIIVAGSSYGKIRRMINDKGQDLDKITPSVPAEIWGLNAPPNAGEQFSVVETEKQAREIAEYRERKYLDKKRSQAQKTSLEELFSKAAGESKIQELPIIIKGDVQGSIEAIEHALQKITHDQVKIRILHTAVGAISESDVSLSKASGGLIVGFNVRASGSVAQKADRDKVDIRYYSIIYNLIDDVKSILGGMLNPIIREKYIGSVEIRKIFNITKIGKVAGSYVTKGIIKRGAGVRLLRDNIVIHEGKLKTLKRFKDDVKEVRENYECGIAFENYNDIKDGDTVEVFELTEEKQVL